MEQGLLSPRGKRGWRGVKEKQSATTDDSVKGNVNDDFGKNISRSSDGVTSSLNANQNLEPEDRTNRFVVDPPLEAMNGKHNDDRTDLDKFSSLDSATTGNASFGPNTRLVLYAKFFKGEPSRKNVNFHSLVAPTGNAGDVDLSLESVGLVSEHFQNSVYRFFLGKRVVYLVVENYVKNTWSKHGLVRRAMIELRADVELKDTIVVVVPKLVGKRFSMCTIRVEYEWNLSGVQVASWSKVGFKPTKQVYQLVSKKNGASACGKKQQAGLTRQEVSNLNPFDALNTVETMMFWQSRPWLWAVWAKAQGIK
ncbi:hypothetical protein Tco_0803779 [Tanacetum coccineum]|uniref:DUF4283 domain-containing protein n=1 Tax=Tanacetum coccineum TaxID=301880 RepID=A0ABQ5A5B9_9ASTR